MVPNVHKSHKAYKAPGERGKGLWRWGKSEIIYPSLHCHHQNEPCIKMGNGESHSFLMFD